METPTAEELRAQIDERRPTAADLERARAALTDRSLALTRLSRKANAEGREFLASEVRQRDRLGGEMLALTALVDDLERQVNPPERKLRFGSPSLGLHHRERQCLSREQSVMDWLRAEGRIRDDEVGLSFDRYVRGLATGEWAGADRERKLMQLAMVEGTPTAGGHLVPTPLAARVIDLARNASRVMQAGAVTVPMTSQTLKVARLTGEGTPAWTAEGSAAADSSLAFDAVTFTAKKLDRLVKVSMELFEDADPRSEEIIARSFAAQIALELDRAALRGSGTGSEPTGIRNVSGVTITSHGANGDTIANLTYNFLVDAVGTVRDNNFEPNAQIVAPRTVTSLGKLKDTTNQYIRPPQALDDIPRLPTKQIPTNLTVGTSTDCSEVYTGQWPELMIGIRTDFRLLFLDQRFIDTGQYAFYAYMRADIQLAHGPAFVVDVGVRS